MSDQSRSLFYYIPLVFGLTAPFMLSLPEAIVAPFLKRYRSQRHGLAFAFTWAVIGTLFLSSSSFKRPHYLLSVIPAYCLLLAPVVDRMFFGAVAVASRAVQFACRFLPTVLACAVIVAGILLVREYPAFLRAYIVISLLVFAAWAAACQLYARGWRTASFALLNVGMVIIMLMIWPVSGLHLHVDAEVGGLVAGLRKNGVRTDDAILWVGDRPSAAIEFYSEYRVQRLINELEMTKIRSDRTTVSRALLKEFERCIRQQLAKPRPVYLVMPAGYYGLLERETDIRSRVLFQLKGYSEVPGDELLVFTQPNSKPRSVSRPS